MLTLEHKSLLLCFTEVIPTALKYALAFSIKDKTKHVKHVLSLLATALLWILLYQASEKSHNLSASIQSFSTRLVYSPIPWHHRAFWKVTNDYQDSQCKAPSPSLTCEWHSELLTAPFLEMHFSFGFGTLQTLDILLTDSAASLPSPLSLSYL